MKYGDKIIKMEGIIIRVKDGAVDIDLIVRLGFLSIPKRMIISDYPLKVGQTVAWNMSFIEQDGPEVNDKYVSNLDIYNKQRKEMSAQHEKNEEV